MQPKEVNSYIVWDTHSDSQDLIVAVFADREDAEQWAEARERQYKIQESDVFLSGEEIFLKEAA